MNKPDLDIALFDRFEEIHLPLQVIENAHWNLNLGRGFRLFFEGKATMVYNSRNRRLRFCDSGKGKKL